MAVATAALVVPFAPVASTSAVAANPVFVVDSIDDAGDGAPGDGRCSIGDGAACTLRAAIEEANATPGHDTIRFAVPGSGPHQIDPARQLPSLTDPDGVTIDGYSQPGAAENSLEHGTDADLRIQVRGQGPSGIDGLEIRSGGNVIRGLSMFDFQRHIRLFGDGATGNEITGNFLGTDASATFGQVERVTNANAVHLERGASRNRIGLPGNENRNLLAGNADKGVAMFDASTRFNEVQNNLFGLTPDGSARLANRGHGIDINFNASDNLVGGDAPGDGNVVAGSDLSGVEISHNVGIGNTTRNRVVNNLIGTTPDGGSAPAYARNVEFGINFEGKPRCAATCLPDISGNVATGNVVVGSSVDVMIWKGAHDNTVERNTIGVLADGSPALSSHLTVWGVLIEAGASDNLVASNTVAGVARGIHVKPDNDFPADCLRRDPVCPADAVFPTSGNTISKNATFDLSLGLGIDLYQPSFQGGYVSGPSIRPDELVNSAIAMPDIVSITPDRLVATACAGCIVEVFVSREPTCQQCWSDHGRAERWIADGVADGFGRVDLDLTIDRTGGGGTVFVGSGVSITATDAGGNTSEHSLRVAADFVTSPRIGCLLRGFCRGG